MKATPIQLQQMRNNREKWKRKKHVCNWCGYLVEGEQKLHKQCEEAKIRCIKSYS